MIAVSPPPALTREGNEALERRLRGLETKRPLDLEVVARAIRRIRRPEALAARLGDALRYTQRVEADVAGLGIETLLPRAGGDFDGRFLAVWVPDELGHADAQSVLLDHLGLPAYQSRPADVVPIQNRLAGTLGRLSAHAYEIVSLAYHTIGAINERLAIAAYTRMSAIAHEMGEVELADALFGPMRRDESAHLGYYRTYARQLSPRLAPWQRAVVRSLVVHTYAPVGAGRAADKAPFGRALAALEQDPHNPAIAPVVHQIAVDLLASPGRRLPPFVVTAMRRCLYHAYGPTAAPALNGSARVTSTLCRVRTRGMSGPISMVAPVVSTTS